MTRAPQNIYDDPTFFEGYKALRDADSGLNGALEIPALLALLPPLAGARVLDLGSGFGDFARKALELGAGSVAAVEISRAMLSEARRRTQDDRVAFHLSSIEAFRAPQGAFDLVVSSLALHYVEDYAAVAGRVFDWLSPGGAFIFSVEHPMCTAAPQGWARDEAGAPRHWPVDRYAEEGPRLTRWFVDGVVKHHRTCATYVNTLIGLGFELRHFGEPVPDPDAQSARPSLALERRRPPVLVISARRPSDSRQPAPPA